MTLLVVSALILQAQAQEFERYGLVATVGGDTVGPLPA